ncbi:ATP-binding protein [Sinorhizobium meliloti]|uniref:ATP-binding protein n=1 Tax=Rhizobium meliloti TaxID=382 RepID=UPI002090A919|nr:ATP-binding protein [Sinorhizobium meliloti]MCO5961793.1 ATP-binding protein [Sinorhizobium meliloti]
MSGELIPFQIETQRVIQLLAKQIYQSPLALLRENTQNAFDAVRQRLHIDGQFNPSIDILLSPDKIVIADNGIGMTPDDLSRHYWTAGSSSKNNAAARAAGVVGTFGIGAMANFGIADRLVVETESATTGERTICRADRAKLDLKQNCIEREVVQSLQKPGTTITAHVAPGEKIDVVKARDYIAEFVSLVDVPVTVNGEIVSKRPIEDLVPHVPETWRSNEQAHVIGPRMTADVTVILSNNADLWLSFANIIWDSKPLTGRLVLRSGHSNLRTFRSGFGLATASVSSFYQFGGIADLLALEPTAGREAITVDGLQLLQSMMTDIDRFVSELLAKRDESDSSTPFMNWVVAHNRYDLCGKLRMTISPGDRISLEEVERRSHPRPMMLYEGADQGVVKAHASEDTPLLILARTNPRRRCEQNFLKNNANVSAISDKPIVKDRRSYGQLSTAESALAYRVESILETDYFVKSIVDFGSISHGLPVLAQKEGDRIRITLNPDGQTVQLLLGLFSTEFGAFGSMAKDFVRNVLFPRIADYVPSSTKQGAEAFLRAIRKAREVFEYADDDLGSLPGIWEEYDEGRIPLEEAVARSRTAVRSSVQVVEVATRAKDVVPDVIENEQALHEAADPAAGLNLDPSPGITRLELTSAAKLLVIDDKEPALRGYRCFLAITDKAREEMGEFFLQPHSTSIVWGGQKTLFIFMHHSGQFGLYYDLQTREVVDAAAGGGAFPTCSIVLKDRIFIPIPDEIRASFVPRFGERKRFEIRADILRAEGGNGSTTNGTSAVG